MVTVPATRRTTQENKQLGITVFIKSAVLGCSAAIWQNKNGQERRLYRFGNMLLIIQMKTGNLA